MADAPSSDLPELFTRAVTSLRQARPRPEVRLAEIAPPGRLAPYTFALTAEVLREGDELASGRLVLLHDPAGQESWDGTLRIVTYVTAELDADMAGDPLLAGVGWSWLIDALDTYGARHTAAGGTVTQTTSVRFGDLAGPPDTADVELRASWTPLETDLGAHLLAWCELLCSTAGLPPPGVTLLSQSSG
ncbi:MAG: DUF3000 domain-containing protein [Pseudonocardiales bacterium]|nr:MAG: DUF3000 domain-containing protein [Pseudonocardiales bacterium]